MQSNETAKDQAYNYIIEQLTNGDMKPGDRLRIPQIAKTIGRSTIPVREAISQLMAEGYLCQIAGNAVCVPETTEVDLRELYDLRSALETHAAAQAIERINEDHLEKLRNLDQQMQDMAQGKSEFDRALWRRLDTDFHRQIFLAAGNRRILKVLSDLHMMSYIFGLIRGVASKEKLTSIANDHAAILKALEEKNAAAAQEEIRNHIKNALKFANENLIEHRMNSMQG